MRPEGTTNLLSEPPCSPLSGPICPRPTEPAWHRRERTRRSWARTLVRLDGARRALSLHHSTKIMPGPFRWAEADEDEVPSPWLVKARAQPPPAPWGRQQQCQMEVPSTFQDMRRQKRNCWFCHACGAGHWDPMAKSCRRCRTPRIATENIHSPWIKQHPPMNVPKGNQHLGADQPPVQQKPQPPAKLQGLLKAFESRLKADGRLPEDEKMDDEEGTADMAAPPAGEGEKPKEDVTKLAETKALLERLGLKEAASKVQESIDRENNSESIPKMKRTLDQAVSRSKKCKEWVISKTATVEELQKRLDEEKEALAQAVSEADRAESLLNAALQEFSKSQVPTAAAQPPTSQASLDGQAMERLEKEILSEQFARSLESKVQNSKHAEVAQTVGQPQLLRGFLAEIVTEVVAAVQRAVKQEVPNSPIQPQKQQTVPAPALAKAAGVKLPDGEQRGPVRRSRSRGGRSSSR